MMGIVGSVPWLML